MKTIDSRAQLNNGVLMPYLGLGTWEAGRGSETVNAVGWALEAGVRHVDTAAFYGNEGEVGEGVRESSVPRGEVFVTTKLWNTDQGRESAKRAFDESFSKLGLDYIDLYLIHWPVEDTRMESWRALEELYDEGRCGAIGVSNYAIHHLRELLDECSVVPAVNQVEFSPFLFQKELLEYCRKKRILLEAYSPLTRTEKFSHKTIKSIAEKHGRTPAQVLIRWALEHEVAVIPKSVRRERIIENASVFDFTLDKEDMSRLDSLNEGYRTCWNPDEIP